MSAARNPSRRSLLWAATALAGVAALPSAGSALPQTVIGWEAEFLAAYRQLPASEQTAYGRLLQSVAAGTPFREAHVQFYLDMGASLEKAERVTAEFMAEIGLGA